MRLLFFLSGAFIPLSGRFAGWKGAFLAFIARIFLTAILSQFSFLVLLVYHLPTLFASLFFTFKTQCRLQQCFVWGVISCCAVLFWEHPLGSQAGLYALLWAIPLIMQYNPNPFSRALTSTFIAHAVGSVIWLYVGLGPSTASSWLALIPLAIIERFFLAGIMAFGILSIEKAQYYLQQKQRRYFALMHTVQNL